MFPNLSLREQMRICFDTNATGPAVIGEAFGPLLRAALKDGNYSPDSIPPTPRIINISSGVGSINRRLDPTGPMYKLQGTQYRASKAALSMVTANQWVEFGPEIKVFAYDPGFTQSNLGPHNKAENGAREPRLSVEPIVEVIEGRRDNEAGLFLNKDGQYPW